MDKAILIEYADMKEEIKDLRRRIEADRREIGRLMKMSVADSVTCGKKGRKPLQVVRIQGKPEARIGRKEKALERKIALLEDLEASLLEKQTEVEEYIQQIEKSELRIMFRLYFIDGLSYPKVAMEMNRIYPKRRIKYTDENVKKKVQRFFKNLENVPQCPDKVC